MAAVLSFGWIRRTALLSLVVCAAYFTTGRLGLEAGLVLEGTVVTPLWPATGVALSCLLWLGPRVWPGISLGSLLVVLSVSEGDFSTLFLVAGNTLAPLASSLLLRRAGYRQDLGRVRDGLVLVFLGALGGMLVSATTATLVMTVTGELAVRDFGAVWMAWWAGDAMGVLVFTPLLEVGRQVRRLSSDRPLEGLALAVVAVAVAAVVSLSTLHLVFLAFPLLIWAALRFELAGSAPTAALVSASTVWAAVEDTGPFSDLSLTEDMIALQVFNGSLALTGLLLAAVVTERRHIRHGLEEACRELAEVVDRLAPESKQVRREKRHGSPCE